MFRTIPRLAAPIAKRAFATSSRALVSRPAVAHIARTNAASPFAAKWQQQRAYSAAAGLSRESIQERILDVLTSFEKVDPAKVRF